MWMSMERVLSSIIEMIKVLSFSSITGVVQAMQCGHALCMRTYVRLLWDIKRNSRHVERLAL